MKHGWTLLSGILTLAACGTAPAWAQGTVTALCSTDQSWCEMAAAEFQKATGMRVLQTRKATGEALAQLRAEAANPKTDLWWGGTGDPFLQAAEQGLLQPYRPAYINDLHAWSVRQYAMSQNMVGGFYTSAIGFGWNTELLKSLHILTKDGRINQDSRRKLKQVQHLLRFLAPMVQASLDRRGDVRIVDHGAGKSYLGFMLYDEVLSRRDGGDVLHRRQHARLPAPHRPHGRAGGAGRDLREDARPLGRRPQDRRV